MFNTLVVLHDEMVNLPILLRTTLKSTPNSDIARKLNVTRFEFGIVCHDFRKQFRSEN